MTNAHRRHHRRSILTVATSLALLTLGAGPAAAVGDGAVVEVDTDGCIAVDVTSTQSISNVVLLFEDGDTQRFEDLPESLTGTFTGSGDDAGETIATVWVKSGNNASGDGPGYGQRFDLDCTAEDPEDPNDPEHPNDPEDPEDPADPADPDDPKDPADPDEGGDDEQSPSEETPPSPRTINDPVDEPVVDEPTAGDDFDDAVLNAVVEPTDPSGEQPHVLGVQESNEVAPDTLPNTGWDSLAVLLAALASFAVGGALLRRTDRAPD